MPLLPAQLRTGQLTWLFQLEWAGQTYHLAEEPVVFPDVGGDVFYRAGFEFAGSYEDALELFADKADPPSIGITLHLGEIVDVPLMIARGFDLTTALGTLQLWLRDDDTASTEILDVLSGHIRQPEYGEASEPVTASLEYQPALHRQELPSPTEKVSDDTWAAASDDLKGEYYPRILGVPGDGSIYSTPGYRVASSKILIAGHAVAATQVAVTEVKGDPATTASGRAVTHEQDSLGQTVATISISGTGVTDDADGEYWIRWADADGGGTPARGGGTMRGAGDVLQWLMEQSDVEWDRGRLAAIIDTLNAFQIDTAILSSPDKRTDPWEFAQDHILPILPISPRFKGANGLHFILWRYDATAAEAVASISADRGEAYRDGPVSYSDYDDIINEIRLGYAWNNQKNKPTSVYVLTGDEKTVVTEGAGSNLHLRRSWTRYGPRVMEASSEVIYSEATAAKVAGWWARAFALPSRLFVYRMSAAFGFLELGDAVLLTDSGIDLTERLCLVESITWEPGGLGLLMGLRSIEDPARDNYSA